MIYDILHRFRYSLHNLRSFKTRPLKFTILVTHMVNIFFQVFEQCSNFRFFMHQKFLYWCRHNSLWLQLWKCVNRFGVISCINQGVRWLIFNSGKWPKTPYKMFTLAVLTWYIFLYLLLWLIDCCLTSNKQYFCYFQLYSLSLFLWCLRPLSTIFSYIVAVSFIGGGNRSVRRKPLSCLESLTNFIT